MTMNINIPVKNSIFGFGGSIGRAAYSKNIAILIGCNLPVALIFVLGDTGAFRGSSSAALTLLFVISAAVVTAVLFINNDIKRIRDIYEDSPIKAVFRFILIRGLLSIFAPLIPFIQAYLCLVPGQSSAPESSVAHAGTTVWAKRLVPMFSSLAESAKSAHANITAGSVEQRLAKLHELKEKGGLTESEYNSAKEALLKKVA